MEIEVLRAGVVFKKCNDIDCVVPIKLFTSFNLAPSSFPPLPPTAPNASSFIAPSFSFLFLSPWEDVVISNNAGVDEVFMKKLDELAKVHRSLCGISSLFSHDSNPLDSVGRLPYYVLIPHFLKQSPLQNSGSIFYNCI